MTRQGALLALFVVSSHLMYAQTRQITLDVRTGNVTATPTDHALTNRDITAMVNLRLSDDVVIEKIRTAPKTDFDTSIAGLKGLKAHKVSDAVIRAMIDARPPVATQVASAPVAPSVTFPDEVGVYVLVKGKFADVDPEIVGWKSGGVFKSTVTLGLDKGHVNGTVMNATSALRLTNPVVFLIRTPEGTSVTEYQLLKLYEKGDRREFRAITGGIIHRSGGAERNAVSFRSEKVASRTWKIHLDELSPGEYGFLPPGISSSSIASAGKIYSFTIVE